MFQAKYEAALQQPNICIVSPDWIQDCVKQKEKVDEERYHPRLLNLTPPPPPPKSPTPPPPPAPVIPKVEPKSEPGNIPFSYTCSDILTIYFHIFIVYRNIPNVPDKGAPHSLRMPKAIKNPLAIVRFSFQNHYFLILKFQICPL